jgi:catalase
VDEAYKHCKAIGATGAGVGLLASFLGEKLTETNTSGELVDAKQGVITSREAATDNFALLFIEAIAQHQHWEWARYT